MLKIQSVDECIDAYQDLSKEVFKVDQVLTGHIPVGDDCCRFDFNVLEGAIKKMIQAKLGDENCGMGAIPTTGNKTCRTFVVTKTAANINSAPTIFRTYDGKQIRPSQCAIWQAARATSAAPTFFKAISIDRPRPAITYVDGGLGYNNPSEVALEEARRIWPTCTEFGLVSIGTGRPQANAIHFSKSTERDLEVPQSVLDNIKSYIPKGATKHWDTVTPLKPGFKALVDMASASAKLVTNSEDVHQRVQRASRSSEKERQFPYFRFNVARDVGDIGLGDWERSEDLAAHTGNYLKEAEIEEQRGLCVKFILSASSSRK
jgi:hypothetical protein